MQKQCKESAAVQDLYLHRAREMQYPDPDRDSSIDCTCDL